MNRQLHGINSRVLGGKIAFLLCFMGDHEKHNRKKLEVIDFVLSTTDNRTRRNPCNGERWD